MGNSHCRPREGGESLRGYLARKFHKISGKRKIDDLVIIAIQDDKKSFGNQTDLELEDLEVETVSKDNCSGSDEKTSSRQTPLENSQTPSEKYQIPLEKCQTYSLEKCQTPSEKCQTPVQTCQFTDDLDKPSAENCCVKTHRQEMVEQNEENDYIRVLQEQLQQVQNELATLRRGSSSNGQNVVIDKVQGDSRSVKSVQSQQPDEIKAAAGAFRCEIESPIENVTYKTPRCTLLHAQGDDKSISDIQPKDDKHINNALVSGEKEVASTIMVRIRDNDKGDTGGDDKKIPKNDGRRRKMQGIITEGLRTSVKLPRNKAQVNAIETVQKIKPQVDKNTAEDEAKTAAKIATLKKRDPTLPRPDKGIVWPKTMANLSQTDKAYYVEQFLRSELFRQRCLRKYQGSKTWMNGLTPFHIWVLENEDTEELEEVLHPLGKRQNNAQAKVKCWRGNTPPPPPKSQ